MQHIRTLEIILLVTATKEACLGYDGKLLVFFGEIRVILLLLLL